MQKRRQAAVALFFEYTSGEWMGPTAEKTINRRDYRSEQSFPDLVKMAARLRLVPAPNG
jgi:hypothetical protein